MSKEAKLIAEGWITTSEAVDVSNYTQDYIRKLARQGRVEATKVGRDWLVNKESLLAYKASVRPGRPKEGKR